jgi:hypothetical protein
LRAVLSALLIAACLTGSAHADARRPSIYAALHRCPLHALATSDNDIRLDMDPRSKGWKVPLPTSVAEVIYRAASKDLASQESEMIRWATSNCDILSDPVYRLKTPNGPNLFVARIDYGAGVDVFHLVLFDPRTSKITRNPLWLSAKWTEVFGFAKDLQKRPPVFGFHRDKKGIQQLVFSEYYHNGTEINSVIDRYFEFGHDMSITQVMAVEKAALEPDSDGLILRRPRQITRGRIEVSVLERLAKGSERKLGSFALVREAAGEPYRVVDRHVVDFASTDGLVDDCDEAAADDEFQREGCDFYY